MIALGGWNGDSTCIDCGCEGGVVQTVLIPFCEIATVTISASRVITAITVTGTGVAGLYVHDNTNDASSYNQTGERVNNLCHQVQQEFTGEMYCLSAESNEEANAIAQSRSVVAIHELESGLKLVQGLDIYLPAGETDYTYKKSKKPTQAIVDVLSGTGAENALVRLKTTSTSRYVSAETSMTIAALAAL